VGAWTYSGIAWVSGHQYVVVARSTDAANNVQNVFNIGTSSNSFTFDTNVPSISITQPGVGRSTGVTQQQGTASTPAPGVLTQVQVRVHGGTPDQYWNPGTTNFDLALTSLESAWFSAA